MACCNLTAWAAQQSDASCSGWQQAGDGPLEQYMPRPHCHPHMLCTAAGGLWLNTERAPPLLSPDPAAHHRAVADQVSQHPADPGTQLLRTLLLWQASVPVLACIVAHCGLCRHSPSLLESCMHMLAQESEASTGIQLFIAGRVYVQPRH